MKNNAYVLNFTVKGKGGNLGLRFFTKDLMILINKIVSGGGQSTWFGDLISGHLIGPCVPGKKLKGHLRY